MASVQRPLTYNWSPVWHLHVVCWNMNSSEVFWIQISITDTGFGHFSKYGTLRCTTIIQYLISLRLTFPLINKHWHKQAAYGNYYWFKLKYLFLFYLCCSISFYALFLYSCLHLHLPFKKQYCILHGIHRDTVEIKRMGLKRRLLVPMWLFYYLGKILKLLVSHFMYLWSRA